MLLIIILLMLSLAFLATLITIFGFWYEKQIVIHTSPSIAVSFLIIANYFQTKHDRHLWFTLIFIVFFFLIERLASFVEKLLFLDLLLYGIAYLTIAITSSYQFGLVQSFFGNISNIDYKLYQNTIYYSLVVLVIIYLFNKQIIYLKVKKQQELFTTRDNPIKIRYRVFHGIFSLFIFISMTILVYYFGILLAMILTTIPIYIARMVTINLYSTALIAFGIEFFVMIFSYLMGESIAIPFSLICSFPLLVLYALLVFVK